MDVSSICRTKVGTPPHLTDRELFVSLELGDPWHDAHVLEVWDFLWKHPHTQIPASWQDDMHKFDAEFRDTLGC